MGGGRRTLGAGRKGTKTEGEAGGIDNTEEGLVRSKS